jgi:hypothetical protein
MWTFPFWLSYIAVWVCTILTAACVFLLYRFVGRSAIDSGPQRIGQGPAPKAAPVRVRAEDEQGRAVTLGNASLSNQLVMFLSTDCASCDGAWLAASEFAELHAEDWEVVVVAGGDVNKTRARASGLDRRVRLIADPKQEIRQRWRVHTIPFSVWLANGIVEMRGDPNSLEQLRLFISGPDERETASRTAEVLSA